MKRILLRPYYVLMLVVMPICFTSCKKDDDGPEPKSEDPVLMEKISTTWLLESASLEGVSRTDFKNVVLTISDKGTYSLKGEFPERSPWPASGTWKFDPNDENSTIIRDAGTGDEVVMSYRVSENGEELFLTFQISGDGWEGGSFGARMSGLIGEWNFTFTASNP